MTDKYALFGNPVSHSRSPEIYATLAKKYNQDMSYTAQQIEPGRFEEEAHFFFANGGLGLNVTAPYKTEAYLYADQNSRRALKAESVNILTLDLGTGCVIGDNTDGIGLVRDLNKRLKFDIENKKILIIGAGGAARGIIGELINKEPKKISIINRTYEKALELVSSFRWSGILSTIDPYEKFDIIINCTSQPNQSLFHEAFYNHKDVNTIAYDLSYDAAFLTTFLQIADNYGIEKLYDGEGMLIEQAAECFRKWRGISP